MVFDDIQNGGEIDQSAEILQLLNAVCMKDEHADVTFIVENTKIPAHKMILSLRSSYFNSLFFGGFAEAKQDEIELKVPLGAFKAILKYIYTGCLSLVHLNSQRIIEIYDLANQYGFDTLKKIILEYLNANLKLDSCISILNASYLYSLDDLQDACMKFMDNHSVELLDHDIFKTLSPSLLCTLLKRDTFYAPEIDIFKAICNWSTNNPDADVKEALSTIRWTELSMDDYLNIVVPSNILEPTQLLRMMNENRGSNNISRTQCCNSSSEKNAEENIATIEHGAKTITGENSSALLLRNSFTNSNAGCTYHRIGLIDPDLQSLSSSIVVDLGKVRFINYIKMLLMDKDSRSYSYFIKVSLDGIEYAQLFKHRFCRSWQYLYFIPRHVRFIKLVGYETIDMDQRQVHTIRGHRSAFDSFDVVELQAKYTSINYPELISGTINPTKNVARIECGATVDKGWGGNNMLSEDPDEFTCHEIKSHILLRFNQPYNIGSIRMLIGNLNYSNKYPFFISTSLDNCNWEMAVDKRDESVSGWQEFDFKPRSAIFIKITGVQRDVNFMCTYFECPRNLQKPKLKRPLKA